jgi:signal transduction histidine kinase/ligand-binding sensor domain-containing protein/DNA-binding response OmpR family regulator
MERFYSYFLSIWFVTASLSSILHAGPTSINCKHFNNNNGLLTSQVEFVFIDSEGFAWIATSNGLQQFDGYNFTNYIYDGSSVSYNFISSVTEDRNGNIWIGTLGRGVDVLNKEKRTFRYLSNQPAGSQVLTTNIVPRGQAVFAEDEEGFMWLNTDNGLNKINIEDFTVEHYYGNFSGELVYDKKENVLWIASNDLRKFNPKTRAIEYYQVITGKNPGNVKVNSLQLDEAGLLWLGTDGGLIVFDRYQKRFYDIEEFPGIKDRLKNTDMSWNCKPVESLHIDGQGCIWIAVDKSIIRLDYVRGSSQVFTHEINNPGSLLNGKITGIYGNDPGSLWVVYASGGISRLTISNQPFEYFRVIPGSPRSLGGNAVRSIFQDSRGNLWIGNYSDGLNFIAAGGDGKVNYFRNDPADPGTISSDYITSIFVDSGERLWIGTFDRGFCYADNIYGAKKLSFERFYYEQNLEVQDFCEDASGNIWVGTQWGFFIYDHDSGRLIHYGENENQLTELQQFNIQSVVYEPPNIFWIATWNRGLSRLIIRSDPRLSSRVMADSLIIYEDITDINQSEIDNSFITLCKDDNLLWLGSYANGLVKMILDSEGARFIQYDKSRGAPGNSVYGIAKDKTGNIIISTNHGLARFDPEKERFTNYYESDGLLSNAFSWNSSFQNPEGKVFFGGINGLIAFYPHELAEKAIEYNVQISRLIVKNKNIQIGDRVNGRQILSKSLPYTDRISLVNEPAFTIEFLAVNPPNPAELTYSYLLKGHDRDWTNTNAGNRSVTYNSLRKGTYTFLVKASNNISHSDQIPASLTVRILPPWWRSATALAAYSILFMSLLLAFRFLIHMRMNLVHKAHFEHLERKKTEELYRFKMRFFADISHEYGNLISLILTPLQNLTSLVSKNPQIAHQTRLIRKNSERLIKLTEQVIDLHKLDLNKMKKFYSMGDIIAYTRDLAFSFGETYVQRSIKIDFVSDTESFVTWFDEDKLDKMIFNLLTNAFNCTPENGEIRVSIGIINNPEGDVNGINNLNQANIIEIRVKDNGIGIPAHSQDQIFERFSRIETKNSPAKRGTGIGLALTRELVELQSGTISLISEENKGTEFIIRLPVIANPGECDEMSEFLSEPIKNRPAGPDPAMEGDHEFIDRHHADNNNRAERGKPVVLLVEDEAEMRYFIRENLRKSYNIHEASNGRKGLDMALKLIPDLIVSDIEMPVMDGIDLCKSIKSDKRICHIPVILLAAHSDTESMVEGLKSGADGYVGKHYGLQLLDAQIRNILKTRRVLKNKFSREFIVKPSDISIKSLDTVFIEKALAVVEKHMQDSEFSTEEFAREMFMSRSKLHRKLTLLTSQSANEFIQSIRLRRAVDLIKNSQMSMEEISILVGFNSPAYFTKCHKKHFGKTPTELKSENSVIPR